ncbi:RidA family protein [SAR202 cluster bacterium AD-804-J14_MRT_500m]|nr:RidA family protein [SAR202 cluster bacterium AD-804-J14_MRT_500m]
MGLDRTNPTEIARPQGFSHIVKFGNTIYISGQVGRKPDGSLAGPDIGSQTEQVFRNLNAALSSANSSMKNVVKTTVFITDREDLDAYRRVRDQVVTSDFPASTLLIVSGLVQPELRIEVEAIAVLD